VLNKVINKLLHVAFLTFVRIAIIYARLKIKNHQENQKKRILALPYYPLNYAGGHERIGDWKNAVEAHGVAFEIHWASDEKFYKSHGLSTNPWKKYRFFFTLTWRRLSMIKRLHRYDAIWIQRAFVPFFPFVNAVFEKAISAHGNVTYDFYDADYLSNLNLVNETIQVAKKVTVPNNFLADYCKKYNAKTHYVPFSFNYSRYPQKKYDERSDNDVLIGWAGAPGNFENVKKIGNQLVQIENEFPQVRFLFVCREKIDVGLRRVAYTKWGDEGFDYMQTLGKFDIGINPMVKVDERTKAKTSFKCMEYMSLGIAFFTSPHGIPNGIKHNESGIIVEHNQDWYAEIKDLLQNPKKIEELGVNARKLIENEHDYFKNTPILLDVLLNTK
jgi:hypothetical protein